MKVFIETYLGPCETSVMNLICENSKLLLAGNCFCESLHHRYFGPKYVFA